LKTVEQRARKKAFRAIEYECFSSAGTGLEVFGNQHRARTDADYTLGNASHEKVLQAGPAVGAKDNQVAVVLASDLIDHGCRVVAFTEEIVEIKVELLGNHPMQFVTQCLDVGFRL